MFGDFDGGDWRKVLARLADFFWVPELQLVPRSLRPGGACYLHLEYGWPLPDLVIRGSWRKFESTHSYLQLGLYASIALRLMPDVKAEGQALDRIWPRGLRLPASSRAQLPQEFVNLFALLGGPGWGSEALARGGVVAAPPPPRLPPSGRRT